MSNNIVWFDIPAVDIDRAIRFYSAVLNKPIKKEDFGGVLTGLFPGSDNRPMGCVCAVADFKPSADGVMIYLGVNGRLKDAVAAVRANGGRCSGIFIRLNPMDSAPRCSTQKATASRFTLRPRRE